MAKIQLSKRAKVEIQDDSGKTLKSFLVTFKEPTRKEAKKLGKDNKEIMESFSKAMSLSKRAELLESKLEALKETEDAKAILKTSNKLEAIYDEQDALEELFESQGGMDKLLEASKITYDMAVGGKDKDALAEFAESESDYGTVLSAIRDDIKESKGKS